MCKMEVVIKRSIFVWTLVFLLGKCRSEQVSSYTAAVVELNPRPGGKVVDQIIEIILSEDVKSADILVFPEAVLNHIHSAIHLPNVTSFCNNSDAHFVLQNISCAARSARKYVVIELYANISCEIDDQAFCAYESDSTNLYNMALVFDRQGDMIARYRKYHLFNERGVQVTAKPDLTTFQTDFNVTFGVFICFDLLFDEPANTLVKQGVNNFVYPTMWFAEIPYMTAAQYQQSWAYGNNVNLLAANTNLPTLDCTGSGIFSGRSGALDVFVSEQPATKILLAKVPTNLSPRLPKSEGLADFSTENRLKMYSQIHQDLEPNINEFSRPDKMWNKPNFPEILQPFGSDEMKLWQENLTDFTVEFLDFSQNLTQSGSVCNYNVCCHYDIEVSDSSQREELPSYHYAISVLNGLRHFKSMPTLQTGQDICSVIACTEMDAKNSCGKRFSMTQLHKRYSFNKLSLKTLITQSPYVTIMPNALANNLIPIDAGDFLFETVKLSEQNMFSVKMTLLAPKMDLLTFAIYSRDYSRDILPKSDHTTDLVSKLNQIPSVIQV